MKHIIRTSSCIAAALALGGCQSFIHSLGFGPKESAQTEQRAEAFGSQELEQGKLALSQGHVAMAIQQFRMAALNEEYAADAFNGLGVAYARLGRADLAERYFKSAVQLDSNNPKYAANLARFYDSALGNSAVALASREREAEAILAKAEAAAIEQGIALPEQEEVATRPAPVMAIASAPQAEPAAPRETKVATATGARGVHSAPIAEVVVRNSSKTEVEAEGDQEEAKAETAAIRGARISLVGAPTQTAGTRPARITVSRGAVRAPSRPRASYPVRVALKRED